MTQYVSIYNPLSLIKKHLPQNYSKQLGKNIRFYITFEPGLGNDFRSFYPFHKF